MCNYFKCSEKSLEHLKENMGEYINPKPLDPELRTREIEYEQDNESDVISEEFDSELILDYMGIRPIPDYYDLD